MLMRVVRQVLPAFGEHHAVDLHLGIRPGHRHVLIHFRQPRAQGTDRPLQPAFAADVRLLMGKVPNFVAPVLQIHVPQPGALLDDQLDRAAMQAAAFERRARRFGQQRGLGTRLENHQRLAQVDAAVGHRRKRMQRLFEPHILGHVQQRAARPAGRVQRGELVLDTDRRRAVRKTAAADRRARAPAAPGCRTARPSLPTSDQAPPPRRWLFMLTARPPSSTPAANSACGCGKFGSRPMPVVLRQTEPIQLEQPNIGPHPLFVADRRHRQF